jgi:hypothetical protein
MEKQGMDRTARNPCHRVNRMAKRAEYKGNNGKEMPNVKKKEEEVKKWREWNHVRTSPQGCPRTCLPNYPIPRHHSTLSDPKISVSVYVVRLEVKKTLVGKYDHENHE